MVIITSIGNLEVEDSYLPPDPIENLDLSLEQEEGFEQEAEEPTHR